MRKFVYIVVMTAMALGMATSTQAQVSWGLKGGVNLGSNDLTLLAKDKNVLNMDGYTGFFVGPKLEIRIPLLGFGVETAALYAQKGMKLTDKETFRQNSLQIPLNIKYTFGLGNMANVFVTAGPELGFNVGETERLISTLDGFDEVTALPTKGEIRGYVAEKSTLSINVGLGTTLLNHFQATLNYNMPWGKTGEFVYIEASEIENAESVRNGENITPDAIETALGTVDKAKNAYNKIMSGTIQISVAYLF